MSNNITTVIKSWKANGHSGYLMTWNGKRRITHKKAKPHKARLDRDLTLKAELAALEEEEAVAENVLVDLFGDIYTVETECDKTDWGLDPEYLADRIYLIDKYVAEKNGKTWFLGRTREHVYTMQYSAEGYAIYVFDQRLDGTYILVLQSGLYSYYDDLYYATFVRI